MNKKDERDIKDLIDADAQELSKNLMACLSSNTPISFEKVPHNPYLSFLLTSKKIYEHSLQPAQPTTAEYLKTINKYDVNLRMDSMEPTKFNEFLTTYYPFDNASDENQNLHKILKPTISFYRSKIFSRELLFTLLQIFSDKKCRNLPALNGFDLKIMNMILSKTMDERILVTNNFLLRKTPKKICKTQRYHVSLKEQYKKCAFKTVIYIMKLMYDQLGKNMLSNKKDKQNFKKKFKNFLSKNFARKSQRLDSKEFEIKFYQTLFSDLLEKDGNAKIHNYVCPTSTRPTIENEQKMILKRPACSSKKLPSKLNTINSYYFETIFASQNFSRLFDDVLKNYLEKFFVSQIRNNFKLLIKSWKMTYLKIKHDKGPIKILKIIRKQIYECKVKLAWPLCKSKLAKNVLEEEFKNFRQS